MSDKGTPSRRSKRGRPAGSPDSERSEVVSTPTRRGRSAKSTPAKTPTRSPRNAVDSPPSQRRRVDSPSSADLAPMPSSPGTNLGSEPPLFSSPGGMRMPDSEIDLSSPLNYGTPSSRLGIGTPRTPGVQGTPIRPRPDVRSDRKMRTVNVGSEQDASRQTSELGSETGSGPQMVIWGTDVVVSYCKEKFKQFVECFTVKSVTDDEKFDGMDITIPLYLQRLEEINLIGEPYLNINSAHLREFDSDLYRQLVAYPQEVIPTFDMAVNELFFTKFEDAVLEHQIQVRPFNSEKTKNMRSLNPEDIDQLISINGMVIRTSTIIPEMRECFFKCYVCQNTTGVEIERGRIAEPTLCTNCQTKHSFQVIHNRSHFTDKQIVKLQEAPEDMPAGQTPHTVSLYAHGDLVDKVQPGDRLTITGIFRAIPMRVQPRARNVKSVYNTHIDVVHYRRQDADRLHECAEDNEQQLFRLSEERMEKIKKLNEQTDVYEQLAAGLAPSIYENVDVKKGVLLQLFGGARKNFSNTGRGSFRSELNILLCGDPGTSKSQLLQYVYNLVPRGQYTSGKGSSAVGLTAYVTKDPETRQLVLQTGALVLSDNGICCIDEFDKMNEGTRSILHEVMEQQTMSIAKAGIICTLNARTSVLAAANPVESQWNKNKTIIDNIQLPHTLLSRFDLIFLILDPQDEHFDRRLANHLVSLYHKTEIEREEKHVPMEVLKDYLNYAKTHVHPRLSEKAGRALTDEYVRMRKVGSGRGQVSAYPRQLESLIRLAEAHAKMRWSDEVTVDDVMEARRLHTEALKQAAVDPSTGRIDISILTTGVSGASRKQRADRAKALKNLIKEKRNVPTLKYQKLYDEFKDRADSFISREMFDDALKDLQDDQELVRTGNHIRLCN